MESLSNRLRQMETEVINLKTDVVQSRLEVVKLEQKLHISEQKIEDLEKELQLKASKPLVISTKCKCGLKRKQAKNVIQKVSAVEQKCENLAKLQGVLNTFLLRAQRKSQDDIQIEDLHAQFISMKQDVTDLESMIKCLEEAKIEKPEIQAEALEPDGKESKVRTSFLKHLDLVRDHKLPLNTNNYVELSALECIAGVANGPARNYGKRISYCFESIQNKHAEDLKKRGCSEVQAMVKYIDVCSQAAKLFGQDLTYDMTFFLASRKDGDNDCIIAMNKSSFIILNVITKQKIKSWHMTAIRNFQEKSKTRLILEMHAEKKVWLDFYVAPGFAQEICDIIKKHQEESRANVAVASLVKLKQETP